MKKFYQPQQHVEDELYVYLRRVFPGNFSEANIHTLPVWIDYENKNGVVTATVKLSWQSKPDFNVNQHLANFIYEQRRGPTGREYHWRCTSGLPNE